MVNNTHEQSEHNRKRKFGPHGILLALALGCFVSGVFAVVFATREPVNISEKHHDKVALNHTTAPRALPTHAQSGLPEQREDCGQVPCIALTFDDGPSRATTPVVLDALSRHNAHATFFVVGSHAVHEPELLREIHKRGNEIGSHSWNHADFTTLNRGQMLEQINQTQAAVTSAGVPAPTLFRPPYGATNDLVKSTIPMSLAYWNVDPKDWSAPNANAIYDRVMSSARPGAVIVMHDTGPMTGQAVEWILTTLTEHGYRIVTFSDLFDLQQSQPGMYFGR